MTGEELALSRQPQDNQLSVSERGHVSFNARNGARDDLVIALAPSVD